jgi:hypothetical protein
MGPASGGLNASRPHGLIRVGLYLCVEHARAIGAAEA